MRRIEIKLGQHPISKNLFSFDSCKKSSLHVDPQNLVNETRCPLLLHAVLVKQTVKSITATATRGGLYSLWASFTGSTNVSDEGCVVS